MRQSGASEELTAGDPNRVPSSLVCSCWILVDKPKVKYKSIPRVWVARVNLHAHQALGLKLRYGSRSEDRPQACIGSSRSRQRT